MDPAKTTVQYESELARLRDLLARQSLAHGLYLRTSGKGAVSVYGLGRFPVTLYKSQWRRILAMVPEITRYLDEHEHELA